MTTEFYTDMQAIAASMLAGFGQDIVIERVEKSVDIVEGDIGAKTVASQTLSGVQLPATTKDKSVFEGLTYSDIRKLLVAAKDATFTPQNGDVVTLETKLYTVQACTPLRPNGTQDLIYDITVMKGAKANA